MPQMLFYLRETLLQKINGINFIEGPIKDLSCGVTRNNGAQTMLQTKVSQYSVIRVSLSLAHDSANLEKKMIGKKQVEVKLDGVRVITMIQGDTSHGKLSRVEMFSRNGKQFHNFGHIIAEIEEVIKDSPPPYDLVLDGEVMSANFQDLMKQVHRKDGKNNDAVLHLFDMCPYPISKVCGTKKEEVYSKGLGRTT